MTTDARAKPAVARASLIVNYVVQDDAHVMFHRQGNDIIRLESATNLKTGEDGLAFIDLQNPAGFIIAASEPVKLFKGDRLVVSTFRTVQKVKLK